MLLSYVCKSVSASDGRLPRRDADTTPRPWAHRATPELSPRRRFLVVPIPSLHWRARPPCPTPIGVFEFSERQASLPQLAEKRHLCPVSEILVSIALVTGHDVCPVCVCPFSQPWASGRARCTLKRGSHPVWGRRPWGDGCFPLCPCPSEDVDGAVRFLKFCTKFSFVITPIFTSQLTYCGSSF